MTPETAAIRYQKFRWVLLPGDDLDPSPHPEWGDSWWYYEFGPDGLVSRLIVLYDNGIRVRYGRDHLADEYGALPSAARQDRMNLLSMDKDIEAAEFKGVWQSGPWTNNPA